MPTWPLLLQIPFHDTTITPGPFFYRYSAGGALQVEEEDAAAMPRSVPVRVAYELQQAAGHRYLDVRYRTADALCTVGLGWPALSSSTTVLDLCTVTEN